MTTCVHAGCRLVVVRPDAFRPSRLFVNRSNDRSARNDFSRCAVGTVFVVDLVGTVGVVMHEMLDEGWGTPRAAEDMLKVSTEDGKLRWSAPLDELGLVFEVLPP